MPQGTMQAVTGILMWVVFFAIFYFFLIRPQKKKDKQLKQMRESLNVGDKVVTIGGIVANVAKVEEDVVVLEIGPSRTKVPFEKWAIASTETKENK